MKKKFMYGIILFIVVVSIGGLAYRLIQDGYNRKALAINQTQKEELKTPALEASPTTLQGKITKTTSDLEEVIDSLDDNIDLSF